MLQNYLKIAYRSLLKNSVYSFINIAGLAIGISSTILISLWVYDELTFDHNQPKLHRLHQVWIHASVNGQKESFASMPIPLYEKLKTADVRIKNTATTDWGDWHLLTTNDKNLRKGGLFVSGEFLEMFQFPLVSGDVKKALEQPNSIILTESASKEMFGDKDPINQVIRVDNKHDVKVTAILKDLPGNSSFQFDLLLPYVLNQGPDLRNDNKESWSGFSYPIYVETIEAGDERIINQNIKNIVNENNKDGIDREVFLYPMSRWRLHSYFYNGVEYSGLIDYVKGFAGIAAFIIFIACINFMNLATARSERRAREVGIRKAVGSSRRDLIKQFLGESVAMTFLSFVVAILITQLVLPLYNGMVSKNLSIDYSSWKFWASSLFMVLTIGLISGSYPAFFLSSFKAVKVLKGNTSSGRRGGLPRKILVTFQFVFSIVAVIGVIGIYKQISHVKSRDIGYRQDNLIYVDATTEIAKNYKAIKNELIESNLAESVTKTNSPITAIYSNNFIRWPGMPSDQDVSMATLASEYDYAKTMGIKMLQGRDFSEDFKSDSSAIIINQAALDIMGLEDPIGTQLDLWGGKRTIVGVIDNAIMGSPFRDATPAFLIFMPDWVSNVTIRLKQTDDPKSQIAKLEAVFKKYNPAYPFNFYFADEEFGKKFAAINLIERLINLFAALALIITGLGLFGLAAFTAEQRTREIGIRKVMGATLNNIVTLVSKDFSIIIFIAFLIAAPIGWYLLNDFLEGYTYRATISWWLLPAVGISIFAIAFLIVSTQALRAARRNPVDSLRSE